MVDLCNVCGEPAYHGFNKDECIDVLKAKIKEMKEVLLWFRDEYSEEVWSIMNHPGFTRSEDFVSAGWNEGVWEEYHEKMKKIEEILNA